MCWVWQIWRMDLRVMSGSVGLGEGAALLCVWEFKCWWADVFAL